MTLQAVVATPGPWLDTDAPCHVPALAAVRAAGKRGIFRYGPLPGASNMAYAAKYDLSAAELTDVCGGGLECGIVQHVRSGLWKPAEHSSAADATAIADWALKIGYPLGCHVALDLESMGGSPYDATTYAIGWQRTMIEAGYRALLYHGFAVPLGPEDLYALPGFDCYWTDVANRPIATRGNAIRQGNGVTMGGVAFDEDAVAPDLLGGLPWVASASTDDGSRIATIGDVA